MNKFLKDLTVLINQWIIHMFAKKIYISYIKCTYTSASLYFPCLVKMKVFRLMAQNSINAGPFVMSFLIAESRQSSTCCHVPPYNKFYTSWKFALLDITNSKQSRICIFKHHSSNIYTLIILSLGNWFLNNKTYTKSRIS